MRKLFFIIVISIFCTFLLPQLSHAHSGGGIVGEYIVTFDQDPLSPFVGENVVVQVTVSDKNGQPINNLAGKIVLKKLQITEYLEASAKQEYKTLYEKVVKTSADGSLTFEHTFKDKGIYDIEFVWGKNEETESAGLMIQPREPTSFFATEEALKRIWLFVGIATFGVIVGALSTFILLTVTLHPKK